MVVFFDYCIVVGGCYDDGFGVCFDMWLLCVDVGVYVVKVVCVVVYVIVDGFVVVCVVCVDELYV